MEVQEGDVMGSNSERETHVIIKGKRTKRPRPASPLTLTMASTTSSSTTTTAELSDVDGGGGGFFHMDPTATVSPASSIEFTKIDVGAQGEKDEDEGEEEEEEDMANCLILLAQGRVTDAQQKPPHRTVPPPHSKAAVAVAVATAGGVGGLYVYECKTCNRSFSSFQALGGHRASHKKPKPPATLEEKKTIIALRKQDGHFEVCNTNNSLSLQATPNKVSSCAININPSINKANNKKVHECSICGAEFTSGQALGGHMRRHRVLPMAPSTTTITTTSDELREGKRQKSLLSLDLNLPAPEDDIREPKSSFGSQDKVIVFSALPLVNCHLYIDQNL